jgi:hypothetical protein
MGSKTADVKPKQYGGMEPAVPMTRALIIRGRISDKSGKDTELKKKTITAYLIFGSQSYRITSVLLIDK